MQNMTTQNVSMTNPYLMEQMAIERRRKLYDALQAQSMEPIEQQPTPPGGFAVPIAPTQGLAKIAQALSAGYGKRKVDEESKALGERYTRERGDVISEALRAGEGTPARPEEVLPEGVVGPPTPGRAAVPANQARVYEVLARNQNFPDLQTAGLAGLLKTPEQYTLAPGAQRFGPNNELLASALPKPEQFTLAPGATRYDAKGNPIISAPSAEKGNWGEPYQMGGAWVQKNDATGQVRQAVGREAQMRVEVPPPVTASIIQDPANPQQQITVDARTYRGGSIGSPGVIGISGKLGDVAKMENKRQFNMQGIGATIQQAEDILSGVERDAGGVTKAVSEPTGSLVGRGVDIVLGTVGAATPGAVQAQRLRSVGGALVAKMPRMEGPQADKDVALYKEMAGQIGDATQPLSTRKAALDTVKQLWAKYERLNPDAFSDRRGATPGPQRRTGDRPTPPPGFVPD